LFESQSEHLTCHRQLEECCFEFLNTKIWFNHIKKKYTLTKQKNITNSSEIKLDFYGKQIGTKFPVFNYIDDEGNKKQIRCHTAIGQEIVGRKLYRDEVVHHIDGNNLNNEPVNLMVINRSEHINIHYSLQTCGSLLMRSGYILFGSKDKRYYVAK